MQSWSVKLNLNDVLEQYGLTAQQGLEKPKEIQRAFQMQSDEINHTSLEVLEQTMHVLAAYALWIQVQHNVRQAELLECKKTYEERLALEAWKIDVSTKSEREAKALETVAELKTMKQKYLQTEVAGLLTKEIPDRIVEKLNVIKKIYDQRCEDRRRGR